VEPFKIAFSKEPLILIPLFISIVFTILFDIIGQIGPVAYFVSVLLIGIFNTFFYAWTTILYDEFKEHEKADLKESFVKIKKLFLDITILSIFVGFLISIGFLAFVIPGIILALFLIFSPCVFVVEDVSLAQSIRKSFSFVFKADHFFQILVVLIAIFLLGLIPYVGVYISTLLEFLWLPYLYVYYRDNSQEIAPQKPQITENKQD
jgi:hypothetical protein